MQNKINLENLAEDIKSRDLKYFSAEARKNFIRILELWRDESNDMRYYRPKLSLKRNLLIGGLSNYLIGKFFPEDPSNRFSGPQTDASKLDRKDPLQKKQIRIIKGIDSFRIASYDEREKFVQSVLGSQRIATHQGLTIRFVHLKEPVYKRIRH